MHLIQLTLVSLLFAANTLTARGYELCVCQEPSGGGATKMCCDAQIIPGRNDIKYSSEKNQCLSDAIQIAGQKFGLCCQQHNGNLAYECDEV
jgi:hypothetical protein